jgi:hypothetical protein
MAAELAPIKRPKIRVQSDLISSTVTSRLAVGTGSGTFFERGESTCLFLTEESRYELFESSTETEQAVARSGGTDSVGASS